jgi:Spx/MgsR family transcriptional regulator
MADTVVYGIPNCDTVKRARAWLDAQGHRYKFHDFKKSGASPDDLDRWLRTLGDDKLVNRQGLTWRRMDEATRARAQGDASLRALLLENLSLIKRPVVQWSDGTLTVGFDETRWQDRLSTLR